MPDQPINLDQIDNIDELNRLYVQCSESLLQAQADVQRHTQNLQAIRGRMAQLQASNAADGQTPDPAPSTEDNQDV